MKKLTSNSAVSKQQYKSCISATYWTGEWYTEA